MTGRSAEPGACSLRPKSSGGKEPVFTATGSISKAVKEFVGGAATGSAECLKHCTRSLGWRQIQGRLFRIVDILTVKWATGDILEERRFSLDTQPMFLKKEKDPTTKIFDGDEWIRSLTEGQAITADIPEERITHDQSEVDSEKVRHIQMGEFLRTYVSIRLPALSESEIAALTAAMRQLGVGSEVGAEALASLHQLIFDEWTSGTPDTPLARYCPTYKRSTSPTLTLEQSETKRKQKSSTASQTWTQLLLVGESTTFALLPLSPQQSMETSHSELPWSSVGVSHTSS